MTPPYKTTIAENIYVEFIEGGETNMIEGFPLFKEYEAEKLCTRLNRAYDLGMVHIIQKLHKIGIDVDLDKLLGDDE